MDIGLQHKVKPLSRFYDNSGGAVVSLCQILFGNPHAKPVSAEIVFEYDNFQLVCGRNWSDQDDQVRSLKKFSSSLLLFAVPWSWHNE